ncbi:acyltransferase family protein [Kribbella sp. NPDC004536]|uniref:acyltransferase family protein n=1 Tax=Kribbella sp. NPDC004536 TaxID=3364106 RepID=UPI00369DCD28
MWTVNAPIGQSARLDFLDRLKLGLVGLVVLHHAAQPYGPPDWWYVQGTERWEPLERFTVVNGAFFMSLFFAISAYLLPRSYERKGGRRFLADRFRRVGAPFVFGVAVIVPVLMYLYHRTYGSYPEFSFAHLWFLQHLLVYALLYAGWRAIRRRPVILQEPRPLTGRTIAGFTAVIALGTYVIRIKWPVDTWVGILGFIQAEVSDLVQYAGLFVAGLFAYKYAWLTGTTRRTGYTCLAIGGALAIAQYAAYPELSRYYAPGGTSFRSLVWSTVEGAMCVTLCVGLVVLFREYVNRPNAFLARLGAASFTVYIVHVPVVVVLQLLVRDLAAAPLVKFLLVGAIALPVSFVLAAGLRRVPYLRAWVGA